MGSHKTVCEDGITRTFHQAGVLSSDGFVYANSRRIYGRSTESYVEGKGYQHNFVAGESSTHRALVQPAAELQSA